MEQPLDRLIPWWRRRKIWAQFQAETGYTLPRLERPNWLVGLTAVLIGLFLVWGTLRHSIEFAAWSAVSMAVLAGFVTWPLAVCFPSEATTIRNLIETILTQNWGRVVTEINVTTAKKTWEILRQAIEETTNISKQDIKWESTWYGDLGMG